MILIKPIFSSTFFSLLFLCLCTNVLALNDYNREGRKEGLWITDNYGNPISKQHKSKSKEGYFVNGRKVGVWILYHTDGLTPRIIGEYKNNRPKGSFFRFAKNGDLQQANSSSVHNEITDQLDAENNQYKCRFKFHESEIVAGQVHFKNSKIKKKNALIFWNDISFNSNNFISNNTSFSWLENNFDAILKNYLLLRDTKIKTQKKESVAQKKNISTQIAPVVKSPRILNGEKFQANGWNKIYNVNNDIWMDGQFVNGSFFNGKVFNYDIDGVLIRVDVYKNGIYYSKGML